MANSDFNVSFKGLDDLYKAFNVAGAKAPDHVAIAVKKTLSEASDRSKRLARVDTGYMRNNIIADPVKKNKNSVVGTYTSRADYSSYNEYGTYKMSAQPFMRPGAIAATPFFYQAVNDELNKVVF